ncbi:MAG: DNA primase [Planctomycetota bacterium]
MDRFEEAKLRVKEATDLVAFIESYLPLKPRGRLLLALCPFHPEKSPSFTVYPDSQHFHCFGCGKSGDVFTFLMEREGLSFREAMESLAERAGVPLEGVFGRGDAERRRGPDPHTVLGEVAAWLQQQLHTDAGAAARDYLAGRGLLDAVEPWTLGFHPALQGALRAQAQQRRWPGAVLDEAGLLRNGREAFAGRVMFPIADERGRIVGFGGRVLPGAPLRADGSEQPKYINSPESPFFNKRRVLYGLHEAKRRGSRRIVVMEGYTDVIACHLAGFHGAVAALGTAFTHEHGAKIERYATDGVVLLFDGDRAGQQAAERAMRELVNSRLQVRIAVMAAAKDPADYVTARPGEDAEQVVERRARFADLVDGADDALASWFRLLRQRHDFAKAGQLEAAARECAALLQRVDGDLRRRALLEEMARHLAVTPQSLARMLRAAPQRQDAGAADGGAADEQAPEPAPRESLPAPFVAAERDVLAAVVQQPELLGRLLDPELERQPLQSRAVTALVEFVREAVAQGRQTRADVVRFVFAGLSDDEHLRAVFAAAIARADELPDPEAFLTSLLRDRHRRVHARAESRSLRQQLQDALDAGDKVTADRLTRELVEQMRQHRPRNVAGGSE